jgi:hypothetical protein
MAGACTGFLQIVKVFVDLRPVHSGAGSIERIQAVIGHSACYS